jgi:hypothetical protein
MVLAAQAQQTHAMQVATPEDAGCDTWLLVNEAKI